MVKYSPWIQKIFPLKVVISTISKDNRHVILHQITNFNQNRSTRGGDITSYDIWFDDRI